MAAASLAFSRHVTDLFTAVDTLSDAPETAPESVPDAAPIVHVAVPVARVEPPAPVAHPEPPAPVAHPEPPPPPQAEPLQGHTAAASPAIAAESPVDRADAAAPVDATASKRAKKGKKKSHRKHSSASSSSSSPSSSSSDSSRRHHHHRHRSRKRSRHHRHSDSSDSRERAAKETRELQRYTEQVQRVADARIGQDRRVPVTAIFNPEKTELERKAAGAHSSVDKSMVVAEKIALEVALRAKNKNGQPMRDTARIAHGSVAMVQAFQTYDKLLAKKKRKNKTANGDEHASPKDSISGDDINSDNSYDAKSRDDEGASEELADFLASDDTGSKSAERRTHRHTKHAFGHLESSESSEADDAGSDGESQSSSKEGKKKVKKEKKEKTEKKKKEKTATAPTPAPAGASHPVLELVLPAVEKPEPVGFRDTTMGQLSMRYQAQIAALFYVTNAEAATIAQPVSSAFATSLRAQEPGAQAKRTPFEVNVAHVAQSLSYTLALLDPHLRAAVTRGICHAQADASIPGLDDKPPLPSNAGQRSFAEEVMNTFARLADAKTRAIYVNLFDAMRDERDATALFYRDLMGARSLQLLSVKPMPKTVERHVCPFSGTAIAEGERVCVFRLIRHGAWEDDAPNHDRAWIAARPWEDPSLLTHHAIFVVRESVVGKPLPLFVRKRTGAPSETPAGVVQSPAKKPRLDVVPVPAVVPVPTPEPFLSMPMLVVPPTDAESKKRKREHDAPAAATVSTLAVPEEPPVKRARPDSGDVVAPPAAERAPVEYVQIRKVDKAAFEGELCVELGALWHLLDEKRRAIVDAASYDIVDQLLGQAREPTALETLAEKFTPVATQDVLTRVLRETGVAQSMNFVMAIVSKLVTPPPAGDDDFAAFLGVTTGAVYREFPRLNLPLLALLIRIRQSYDKRVLAANRSVENDTDRAVATLAAGTASFEAVFGAHALPVLAFVHAIFGSA
jgi:hypothetical protein